jgi:hypothetical protein
MVQNRIYFPVVIVVALAVGQLSAIAEVPSCSECEYLVNNFSGSYPSERERVNWECFDRSSKISIACTFVRGDDILKYSDVYRKRTSLTTDRPPLFRDITRPEFLDRTR